MSDNQRYDSTRKAWETIWDKASVDVELQTIQYPRAQEQIRHYLPYLPKDALILEAGSGLSAAVITLRQMGYPVIGLDYAENALHISRDHTPDLPLLVGDVHALPHPDNSIGAYLSFGVLEHFEQGMGAALQEAYRVLRPDGIAIITIPYPNIIWRLAQWRREQQGRKLIDEDFYESTYTGHAYTFWGVSRLFQGYGYYKTNALAETFGTITRTVAPWLFNFMTMIIARKPKNN
jgi:ubiquinone/menaquinone biosynthesis C-methylase UbiE